MNSLERAQLELSQSELTFKELLRKSPQIIQQEIIERRQRLQELIAESEKLKKEADRKRNEILSEQQKIKDKLLRELQEISKPSYIENSELMATYRTISIIKQDTTLPDDVRARTISNLLKHVKDIVSG